MTDKTNENNQEMVSPLAALFYGEIVEEALFPFPKFSSDQSEMAKGMCDAVNRFAEDQIDGTKMDEEARIPEEVLKGLGELGLFGLGVEEEFGGLGLDHTLYARVFQEVGGIDGSIATTLGAHQSIGFKALINEGTEEQKQKWLPKLASGEVIAAFCLTEPGAGSDAYSIRTKATKNPDGTFTLNGQKIWITNGGIANFYTVFCKTEHERDGKTVEKISCFYVEGGTEGLSFGEKENKMGIRASETRAVYFDNVKIPAENLIGEYGRGFKVAMNVLNTGRLSLGSGCVGGMKVALKMATEQAANRKQFDKPICEFGIIQEKLAHMTASIYASESLVYMTTGLMVKGLKDFSLESAACKVYCSESLWSVVDTSLQIAAGNGYMKEYPYERIMRDSRINLIFEGTNEILRCFLCLQGMRGPSEELKELGKIADVSNALSDPIKSLGVLTDFAKKRLGKMIFPKSVSLVHPELAEWGEELSTMVGEFSIKVENTLMKFGKKIIDNELPQRRLADMVVDIYVMLCVLSRTSSILGIKEVSEEKKLHVKELTDLICKERMQTFQLNSKAMSGKTDKKIMSISNYIVKKGQYDLDVIDY